MLTSDVCRACLAYEVKMFYLDNKSLNLYYELCGSNKVSRDSTMPQKICYECHALFRKIYGFRDKSSMAETLLQMLQQNNEITKVDIDILRTEHKLNSHLTVRKGTPHTFALPLFPTNYVDVPVKKELNIEYEPIESKVVQRKIEQPAKKEESDSDNDDFDGDHDFSDDDSEDFPTDNDNFELDNDKNVDEIKFEDIIKTDTELSEVDDNKDLMKKVKEFMAKKKSVKQSTKRKIRSVLKIKKPLKKGINRRFVFKVDFVTEIILTRQEQIEEMKKRESSTNYVSSPMKCNRCYRGFQSEDAYRNHMAKHTDIAGKYECDICGLHYRDKKHMSSHLDNHMRRFACKRCPTVSESPEKARLHENSHKGVTYHCKVCNKVFDKRSSRTNHVRRLHPSVSCHVCGKSFVGDYGLRMHMLRAHGAAGEHVAATRPQLWDTRAPGEEGDNYCKECDIPFATAMALTTHLLKSSKHSAGSDYGNICWLCGQNLLTRLMLTRHINNHFRDTAPGQPSKPRRPRGYNKRWKCQNCGARFPCDAYLQNHLNKMQDGVCNTRAFVCEMCGWRFQSNAHLQCHLRTHTGERPFRCDTCSKGFITQARLVAHVRIHTGERPFACETCGKCFKDQSAVQRHSSVHTGARPHACMCCSKAFTSRSWLRRHMSTAHGKAIHDDIPSSVPVHNLHLEIIRE